MCSEAIDNQAGQQIAFAVDKTILGRIEKGVTQLQGLHHAVREKVMIENTGGAAEYAGADKGLGVNVGHAEKFPEMCLHPDLFPRLKLLQGCFLAVDFVAEYP